MNEESSVPVMYKSFSCTLVKMLCDCSRAIIYPDLLALTIRIFEGGVSQNILSRKKSASVSEEECISWTISVCNVQGRLCSRRLLYVYCQRRFIIS